MLNYQMVAAFWDQGHSIPPDQGIKASARLQLLHFPGASPFPQHNPLLLSFLGSTRCSPMFSNALHATMERSCVYPCLQQSLSRGPPTNRKVVVERTTTLCIYCEPQNDGYRHAKRARMKCCEVPLYFILQAVLIKSVFPNIKYHQIMFSHQFFQHVSSFSQWISTSFPTWVFRRGHGLGDHGLITVLPTEAWRSKQRGQVWWYGRYLHFFILKSSRKSWIFKKFMRIFCDTWSPQKST